MPLAKIYHSSLGALTLRAWLMMVMRTWNMYVKATQLEGTEMELARLQEKLGKTEKSIWLMNKAELIEVARKELPGMTVAQALQKETVNTLRTRIKNHRDLQKEAENPLLQLPKGLSKMPLEDMKKECTARQIPFPDKARRGDLEILIRDQVENLKTLSSSASTQGATASTSVEEDLSDWMSVQDEGPPTKRGR